MRKFLLFLFLISFMSSAHSELKIKIQKAEIGALPIIISIKGDSEIFSSKNFSSIIEIIALLTIGKCTEMKCVLHAPVRLMLLEILIYK